MNFLCRFLGGKINIIYKTHMSESMGLSYDILRVPVVKKCSAVALYNIFYLPMPVA